MNNKWVKLCEGITSGVIAVFCIISLICSIAFFCSGNIMLGIVLLATMALLLIGVIPTFMIIECIKNIASIEYHTEMLAKSAILEQIETQSETENKNGKRSTTESGSQGKNSSMEDKSKSLRSELFDMFSDLKDEESDEDEDLTDNVPNSDECPNCFHKITKNDEECPYCGYKLKTK